MTGWQCSGYTARYIYFALENDDQAFAYPSDFRQNGARIEGFDCAEPPNPLELGELKDRKHLDAASIDDRWIGRVHF